MTLLKKIINFISILLFIGLNKEEKIELAHENLKRSNNLKKIDKIKFEIEKKKIEFDLKKFNFLKESSNDIENYERTLNQILHLELIINSYFTSHLAISIYKKKKILFSFT